MFNLASGRKKKQLTSEPPSSKRAISFIIIAPSEKSNMKIADLSLASILISNLLPAYDLTDNPLPVPRFNINYARISSIESFRKKVAFPRFHRRENPLSTFRLFSRNSNWMIRFRGRVKFSRQIRVRIFVFLRRRKIPNFDIGWLGFGSRASRRREIKSMERSSISS